MLYCVGRYHPTPGENGDLPAGYDLTADELDEIGGLDGVPITLEHSGISAAVAFFRFKAGERLQRALCWTRYVSMIFRRWL